MKIFYCILWIFAINFNSCATVDSKEAKAIRARETEEQVIRWHGASIENSEFAPQTLKLPSFLRSRSGGQEFEIIQLLEELEIEQGLRNHDASLSILQKSRDW